MAHHAQSGGTVESYDGPVRTCVGWGKQGRRADLIRIVATPTGAARVDPGRSLPGRGAWIHPDPSCLARARRTRAIIRALRLSHHEGDEVWARLEEIAQSAAHLASDNENTKAGWKPMGTR